MKDSSVYSPDHIISPPWHVFSNVNFSIPTEVSTSGVPGGGRARFACGAASTGARVYAAPLLAAADFVADTPGGCVPAGEAPMLVLTGAADLDALAVHFASAPGGGGADLAEVREKISWFLGGVRGKNDDGGDLIAAHSLHFNHSEKYNLRPSVEDGLFVIHAVCDIQSGDELFFDYNAFEISEESTNWLQQHGLRDTKSMVTEWQRFGQEVGA